MLDSKKKLKEYIEIEKNIYEKLGYKGKLHAILSQCEIGMIYAYIVSLRNDEFYTNKQNKSVLDKVKLVYYHRKHNKLGIKLGLSIPVNTFGKGLVVYHSQGIIVHRESRCGEYCKLHGMNCIGNNGSENKIDTNSTPMIGNNVDIGIGASIIGLVKIADNVRVAAGAVVCKSCNDVGTVLKGVPAKSY